MGMEKQFLHFRLGHIQPILIIDTVGFGFFKGFFKIDHPVSVFGIRTHDPVQFGLKKKAFPDAAN